MNRITRRIAGTDTIELVDGKGYANLTHEEVVRLLFKTIADCEDKLEKRESTLHAYFSLEDWLYSEAGKDKPVEIQAAMAWGALWVVSKHGDINWDTMRNMFGEFMSKKMNLR
ncbi:hypothetical protein D3C74_282270 [compost metagenome]